MAIEEGGIFLDTGAEVWTLVERSGLDPWIVNEQFLRSQLEAKVPRIDFVGEDVNMLLEAYALKSFEEVPFRVKEIRWLLEHSHDYGYERIGNSWILKNP